MSERIKKRKKEICLLLNSFLEKLEADPEGTLGEISFWIEPYDNGQEAGKTIRISIPNSYVADYKRREGAELILEMEKSK
jgi:hypothetical protein